MVHSKLPDTGDEITNSLLKTAYKDGLADGRKDMLDWLEQRYMGEDRPNRGTPEAQNILDLAKKAAEHIRSLPDA